ncbi:hypothetical protein HCN44_010882 [Aphidius gifuensis]|uniref:Uncharacterized protein n=1 Tax=Aphidius gifuensis TaxID=684658 RepID=A0A834XSV2_APHGI|nr:hypothetical protein HCN44_010882 [Aphidius gifuensis]
MPVDEIVITNEIPVNEPVRENDNETPVDGPGVENDIAYVKYETAAAMFANAQLEIEIPADDVMLLTNEIPVNDPVRENDNETPVDGPGDKNDRDLVRNALEENNLEEKTYSEIKKLAITSVEILPPTKRITMNSQKITKKQKERSKDDNTEKLGEKIMTVDEEEHQYRPKAGSSKPKNESVDITDFCVDCEGYQCPNEAATPHHQFCKGCHEKCQMGEQPHYPHPSPVKIPNTIIKKRQQIVDERIKCSQDQIRELEESLSHVKCDLCGGEPIVNEFGHCERCAQLID